MISSERMAAVDRNAAALGVPTRVLMESSGNAVARAVRDVAEPSSTVAIVAGRGNNGGDGFVAARFLDDYDVTVSLLGRRETISTDISRENWDALQKTECPTDTVTDSRNLDLGDPDVVVDALLGTGGSGEPREPERTAIEHINDTDAHVVSVDVPSGLDADTGETPGVWVNADTAVTFHDEKPGLAEHGDWEVVVADIGIPDAAETFVGPGDLLSLSRPSDAHKGEFGRVLVVGGGPYTGAPALTAQAALRGGADLSFVLCPDPVAETIQGYGPDLIVDGLVGTRLVPEHVDTILEKTESVGADVVVLGPGLGDSSDTLDAVGRFLEAFDGRIVVDADALQAVPDADTEATVVCTPHQGELREMGGPSADDWETRAEAVTSFAAELGHTILVKGKYDIATDGETTRVNRTGNPGMTVGGTGDVLAGVTAALLATQEPVHAAALGAYVNGLAGDAVVEESGYGLLASDLLPALPRALWGEHE